MNLKFILVSCFLFINTYVVDAFLSLSPKIPLINKQSSIIFPNLYLTENDGGGIGGGNNRICNGNNNGGNDDDGGNDDYKYFYWIVILNMCMIKTTLNNTFDLMNYFQK
jgi:hypothetical protein